MSPSSLSQDWGNTMVEMSPRGSPPSGPSAPRGHCTGAKGYKRVIEKETPQVPGSAVTEVPSVRVPGREESGCRQAYGLISLGNESLSPDLSPVSRLQVCHGFPSPDRCVLVCFVCSVRGACMVLPYFRVIRVIPCFP